MTVADDFHDVEMLKETGRQLRIGTTTCLMGGTTLQILSESELAAGRESMRAMPKPRECIRGTEHGMLSRLYFPFAK